MHQFYKRPKRKWWLPILGAVVAITGTVVVFLLNPNSHTFNGFELHGGPIVLNRASNPMVVALTSHWETRSITTGRYATTASNYGQLHWDVFAFNASDLSQRWTTRLATVRRGQRDIDATILGLSHNTLWVWADSLMGVSLDKGAVVADAASLEQATPQLRGMMPSSRRQVYFDNGLVLIAADGRRWRVDDESLRATPDTATVPIKTSVMGVPTPRATDSLNVLPVSLSSQTSWFKKRDFVIGDTWYGMMHPSEIELQRRDPHTQDFNSGLRFRLWSTPLRDTLDRMRQPAKLPLDFAPLAASPEFLYGGLLSVADAENRKRVVGIANPTRLIVLHQDRIDDSAQQILTCLALDGRLCWDAALQMRSVTSVSMLSKGAPDTWALVVTGDAKPQSGDKMVDDAGDALPVLARVNIADGTVTRFRFADVDFEKLSKALKPYRFRKQ